MEKERKQAFETHMLDEEPRLTNIRSVVAYEYFNHGWNDAMTYIAQLNSPVKTTMVTSDNIYLEPAVEEKLPTPVTQLQPSLTPFKPGEISDFAKRINSITSNKHGRSLA